MQLCLHNPNLISDRKALLEASRKKLDESGYCYKKGKSRSKRLSTDDGNEPSVNKRSKINKEFHLARIAELQEQIKDKNEQVQYKELRREAAKNVHNYKECDKLTEQMSILKADRRQLELELAGLTKKQKKSEWYFNKTSTPLKVPAPRLNSSTSWCLPSSSPEPQSPLSSSAPRTPTSSGSSIHFTPSPRVPVHQHICSLSDDNDESRMLSPHESDDTMILSSDESSQLPPPSSSQLPPPSSSQLPPPSSSMQSSHENENPVILTSDESSSQFPSPSSELPPPLPSQFPPQSSDLHPPSLRREKALWKPHDPDHHDSSQPSSSTISPSHPCCGSTSSSVISGQHFQ